MDSPLVSIIMPVFNRFELTKQSISTLLDNTNILIIPYELIIIDDNSTDDQLMSYYKDIESTFEQIRVIRMNNQTHHGACCNAGVAVSKGEYLYFTDNDIYFTDNWLSLLLTTLKHRPYFGILGGDRHPHHGINELWPEEGFIEPIEESDTQVGYSMLMKRETFIKYGPFRHDPLHIYGGDDSMLCENVLRAGLRVGAISPRVVFHCGITNSMGTLGAGADMFLDQGGPEGIIKL